MRPTIRRPWHVWPVGLLVLAIYLGGLRDFLLVLLDDTGYIQTQFGAGGLTYFGGYPWPLRLLWAVNIAAGLLAPVLVLARHRWCAPVAGTAAVAQVVLMALTFTLRDRLRLLGPSVAAFDTGIAVVTIGFAWYCWWLTRRGRTAAR